MILGCASHPGLIHAAPPAEPLPSGHHSPTSDPGTTTRDARTKIGDDIAAFHEELRNEFSTYRKTLNQGDPSPAEYREAILRWREANRAGYEWLEDRITRFAAANSEGSPAPRPNPPAAPAELTATERARFRTIAESIAVHRKEAAESAGGERMRQLLMMRAEKEKLAPLMAAALRNLPREPGRGRRPADVPERRLHEANAELRSFLEESDLARLGPKGRARLAALRREKATRLQALLDEINPNPPSKHEDKPNQ